MLNPFGIVPVTRLWHEWTPVPGLDGEVHNVAWNDTARHESTPLVLMHGLGVSGRYWSRLGRRLAGSFEVLAPDMPGFGDTPRDRRLRWPGGPNVREQADHLKAWLDARRLGRVFLCGHSTGCQVVTDLAARFPDRVERLILIAPTVQKHRRSLWDYAPRLLAGGVYEAPSLVPLMAVEYLNTGPVRLLQQGVRMMGDAIEERLPKLTMPTLVIRGTLDPLAPQSWAETIVRNLPNGRLVTIDRVGHAAHYSAPRVTAQVMADFLHGDYTLAPPVGDANHAADDADESAAEVAENALVDAASNDSGGAIAAVEDDPRHDKLGPPQPVSPAVHAVMDYAAAGATLLLPALIPLGPRTRRLLAITAAVSTGVNLLSDHPLAARRTLPMLTHAHADLASGIHLLTASATYLRREPRLGRLAVAALGAFQIASAVLTAKPTGPARFRR